MPLDVAVKATLSNRLSNRSTLQQKQLPSTYLLLTLLPDITHFPQPDGPNHQADNIRREQEPERHPVPDHVPIGLVSLSRGGLIIADDIGDQLDKGQSETLSNLRKRVKDTAR